MSNATARIASIPGDGIGPDVIDATFAVIEAARLKVGGFDIAREHIDAGISPHLRLRDRYGLYAGVRPVKAYPNAPQRLADPRAAQLDLVILRESTEGLFFTAAAFKLARKRKSRGGKGLVTCVDKANVFVSMAFFRKVFDERRAACPDIEVGYNYVDAMALDLVRKPWEFDVLVMENMFGDILSDLAGGLVGGMGMASCGEIGDHHGLFQGAHGSAPDIMGQDKANPLAAILSGGLMLDYLAEKLDVPQMAEAAALIEAAVDSGFHDNRLRPMEFGGDMGTLAVTKELVSRIE